jgi:hypothetical protein
LFSKTWNAEFPSSEQRLMVSGQGLARDEDYRLVLRVSREGVPLAGAVHFNKEKFQPGKVDPTPYLDPNGVREFRMIGENEGAALAFTDETPASEKVVTSYSIRLERRLLKFLWKTTIAEAEFQRKALQVDSDGKLLIRMKDFPGVSERELEKFFDGGDNVFVTVRVKRTSALFPGGTPIVFEKEAKLRLK